VRHIEAQEVRDVLNDAIIPTLAHMFQQLADFEKRPK
jgi:hypothetical protein